MSTVAEKPASSGPTRVSVNLADIVERNIRRVVVLVLYSNAWAFTDEKTGEAREGVTVWAATPAPPVEGREDQRGWLPEKYTVPFGEAAALKAVPAFFECSAIKGPKGDKLSDFKLLARVEAVS